MLNGYITDITDDQHPGNPESTESTMWEWKTRKKVLIAIMLNCINTGQYHKQTVAVQAIKNRGAMLQSPYGPLVYSSVTRPPVNNW